MTLQSFLSEYVLASLLDIASIAIKRNYGDSTNTRIIGVEDCHLSVSQQSELRKIDESIGYFEENYNDLITIYETIERNLRTKSKAQAELLEKLKNTSISSEDRQKIIAEIRQNFREYNNDTQDDLLREIEEKQDILERILIDIKYNNVLPANNKRDIAEYLDKKITELDAFSQKIRGLKQKINSYMLLDEKSIKALVSEESTLLDSEKDKNRKILMEMNAVGRRYIGKLDKPRIVSKQSFDSVKALSETDLCEHGISRVKRKFDSDTVRVALDDNSRTPNMGIGGGLTF